MSLDCGALMTSPKKPQTSSLNSMMTPASRPTTPLACRIRSSSLKREPTELYEVRDPDEVVLRLRVCEELVRQDRLLSPLHIRWCSSCLMCPRASDAGPPTSPRSGGHPAPSRWSPSMSVVEKSGEASAGRP